MGQIAAAPEQDEDQLYDEARQRALDRFTFDRPAPEPSEPLAQIAIRGALFLLAMILFCATRQ